jgi:hypothetical protein
MPVESAAGFAVGFGPATRAAAGGHEAAGPFDLSGQPQPGNWTL